MCGCVDVWKRGCVDVDVWMCGCVDVWMRGCVDVDVWMCGCDVCIWKRGYVDMRRKLSHELMCDLCTTVGLQQLVVLGLAQVCAGWVGFAQAGFAQTGFAQTGFAQG